MLEAVLVVPLWFAVGLDVFVAIYCSVGDRRRENMDRLMKSSEGRGVILLIAAVWPIVLWGAVEEWYEYRTGR